MNEHTAGDQGSPAVAMEVSGAFAVSWESADQDGHLAGLYERRFDPWGAPEGPEMPVNVSTCRAQQSPSLTLDAAGRALVAWSSPQDVSNRMIFARQMDPAGSSPPSVTAPFDGVVCPGMEAFFSVAPIGTGPFSYQWRENGVPLSDGGRVAGAHEATLFIANAGMGDSGKTYDCVVTDGSSPPHTIDSSSAVLTVGHDDRVGDTLLMRKGAGTYLVSRWTNVPTAVDYAFYDAPSPTGPFSLFFNSSTGEADHSFQPYFGSRFYLVSGRNALCEGQLH